MADAKPTLEPTEWQREIADKCWNDMGEPRDAYTVLLEAFVEACARQREEDAKIASEWEASVVNEPYRAWARCIAAAIRGAK